MKRFRMWLKELSLSQQLLTIIFLFITVFGIFLFVFLSPSIDQFSDNAMYGVLHSTQENLVYYLNNNPDSVPYVIVDNTTTSVTHVLYEKEKDSFVQISGMTLTDTIKGEIRAKAYLNFTGTRDYRAAVEKDDGSTAVYLFSMTRLEDGRYLASLITDEYRDVFEKSLLNAVVNMNIVVVAALFVLLMLWVMSLIVPLSQIKTYISKIRNDEKAELDIHRRDEIGEVAVALRQMEAELSEQNREKQEMIQNISHDLKTPIATIKSYSESIKDGIYPYDTLEKSCDVIIEHANRLEKKVGSLIILNKMDYLIDTLEEGDHLDMNSVIDKVMLSLKVIRPEISLVKDTEEGVCFHGEEEPWRITVENLIENALRYAKKEIVIKLREGELCVINDGPDIEEDRLDKLFSPYEKGTGGKFGLGLSIVYKVCTTYGYHVSAENLTEGVCFRIYKDEAMKPKKKRSKKQKKGNS